MSFFTNQAAVSGTPFEIVASVDFDRQVTVKSKTGTIYVGFNNGVDSGDGFELTNQQSITLILPADESLWITGSGTATYLIGGAP